MLFHQEDNRTFALGGNHMIGLATPSRGAQTTELWRGRMDAGAATPLHQHDHEEVVLFLSGSGRATVGTQEVRYRAGDTVILPPNTLHQIFADTDTDLVAAMALATPITTPDGAVLDLPWRR